MVLKQRTITSICRVAIIQRKSTLPVRFHKLSNCCVKHFAHDSSHIRVCDITLTTFQLPPSMFSLKQLVVIAYKYLHKITKTTQHAFEAVSQHVSLLTVMS